jgi:SAM-dependent methyltransferase
MRATRYAQAVTSARRRRVLEVACGQGRGLGAIARVAKRVVGGDAAFEPLRRARCHYGPSIPLVQFDAEALPFVTASMDVIICFEAIYLFTDVDAFLEECRRVLASAGVVVMCAANPEWKGFKPSEGSTRYYSAREMADLLAHHGFGAELRVEFPVRWQGIRQQVFDGVRRVLLACGLQPAGIPGREWLKQAVFGRTTWVAAEIADDGEVQTLEPPLDDRVIGFKVLYATGRLP